MHLSRQRMHKKSKNYASFIYSEYTIEYSLIRDQPQLSIFNRLEITAW